MKFVSKINPQTEIHAHQWHGITTDLIRDLPSPSGLVISTKQTICGTSLEISLYINDINQETTDKVPLGHFVFKKDARWRHLPSAEFRSNFTPKSEIKLQKLPGC